MDTLIFIILHGWYKPEWTGAPLQAALRQQHPYKTDLSLSKSSLKGARKNINPYIEFLKGNLIKNFHLC